MLPAPFHRNAGGPGHPGAAQKVEGQGFRLVALMMSEQEQFAGRTGKHPVTRLACRRFEPETTVAVDFDTFDEQFDAEITAIVGAESGPAIGIRRQAVMNVNGAQIPARTKNSENMQEDDRIATARESYAKVLARRRAGCEKCGNPGRKATLQAVP